jgi:hypothetical protein
MGKKSHASNLFKRGATSSSPTSLFRVDIKLLDEHNQFEVTAKQSLKE